MPVNTINEINPFHFSLIALGSASLFAIFWLFDSVTHGKLVHTDITGKELNTHRNILAASFVMDAALVLMYWMPLLSLPLFIAAFITRTAHEFIDELHFHADRCSSYETMLHLVMWLSILTNTAALFIWGFFKQYDGIESLPVLFYIWGGILFILLTYISYVEWKR